MSASLPDPRAARTFHFSGCEYDPSSGVARMAYAFDDGPPLVESLHFPHAPWPTEANRQWAFMRALELTHQVAGVSYWKAGLTPAMQVDGGAPDPGRLDFLSAVYHHGLAEFAATNDVDVPERLPLDASDTPAQPAVPLELPARSLVAIGGGKDSLVTLEALRDAGREVQPFCVGASALIEDTVRAAGLPLLRVGRRLAPELTAMNDAGAWNGHVPVTAINSCIGVCAALLYGFGEVVFSNERSADEPTRRRAEGHDVNHQWSKSFAFERALQDELSRTVSPDLHYYSLLRPWWEVTVAGRFAQLEAFHDVFSSCNRNFHQDGSQVEGRWCRDCPKCRFTALALAPFFEPGALSRILGTDLLDDEQQIEGFRALLELDRERPYECIGTVPETRALLAALASRPQWQNHAVVAALAPELPADTPTLTALMAEHGPHRLPPDLAERFGGRV